MSQESNNNALKNLRVLRQAFFLASAFITIGLIGYFLGYSYFIVLPVLVAFGLMFSALVGWCPMIYLLEKTFWNK
ncbi:MAG: DUF2892 domain-containing protein [Candidatus Kaiserbacteria bacterium]|nr:DUF2892 domain-containing protein [Candidatus Kaiserbacteria bacterium]